MAQMFGNQDPIFAKNEAPPRLNENMPSQMNQPSLAAVNSGSSAKMRQSRVGNSVAASAGRAILGQEKAYAQQSFAYANKATPFGNLVENSDSHKNVNGTSSNRGFSESNARLNIGNMNRSYQNRPKKQGRQFGLSLGQDDGPFKQKKLNGCPQIDKFATYSLQSIAAQKTSPRIGILGATTFPSQSDIFASNAESKAGLPSAGGRIDDVSASVNKQIKNLEDQLVSGYDLLQVFKEEADEIRKQIDVMMNVLVEKTEIVQEELHQSSRGDYKKLKADIKAQRDENEILYKGMKNLVKETESQRTKVGIFQAKVEELEQHVGILANSPDAGMSGHPLILEENAELGDARLGHEYNDVTQDDPQINQLQVQNELQRNTLNQVSVQQNLSQNNLAASGGNSMSDIANQRQQYPTMTVSNNALAEKGDNILHLD